MSQAANKNAENIGKKADDVREEFQENSFYNLGVEIEDLVFDEDLNPLTKGLAHETLRNIDEDPEVRTNPVEKEVEGEEVIKKVELLDSPFYENGGEDEDFLGEFDFDLNPRQSEIATPIVNHPTDALFEAERMQRIRDRNLPEGYRAHSAGLTPESMFPGRIEGDLNLIEFLRGNFDIDPNEDRMNGERYRGLADAHGPELYAMGATGSIQTNAGTDAETNAEVDQQFFQVYNGGDNASIMALARPISSKSNTDRVHLAWLNDDGDEEFVPILDSGRDLSYDVFVNSSEAAERPEGTRWTELAVAFGEEIKVERNDNYGFINRFSELEEEETTEDLISKLLEINKIMPAAEVTAGDVFVDESTSLADLKGLEEDETDTVFFDHDADEGNLGEILEEGEYSAKFLIDGEMRSGTVKHNTDSGDFQDLFSGYVDMQDTMVRADDANKMEGIEEWRSSSNNPDKNQTILSDIGTLRSKEDIQEVFKNAGVSNENEQDFRDRAALEGIEAKVDDSIDLEDVTYMGLLPKFVDGIRDSFKPDELAYTFEIAARSYQDSAVTDFKEFMDSWESMDDFIDWSVRYHQAMGGNQGELEYSEWETEYEQFIDWTAETYVSDMVELYEKGTPNERITAEANAQTPEEAYKSLARSSS